MPVKKILYKGKTIYYSDYRNMTVNQEMQGMANLDEMAEIARTWTEKSPVLVLSDFRNSKATPAFMAHAKKLAKEVFSKVDHKGAAIGITGVKNILLQAYNVFKKDKLVPFATEEEAKEWLIKD
jgi:hypothetical protein